VRALFFGTPEFAVPSLDALCAVSEVIGVVCQPDRPAGRGLATVATPVKARAIALGLPVVQPIKLKTGEVAEWVRSLAADVALVAAYGRILPEAVLAATRLGFVNVHASLLPKYRGAAPIAWAIVNGETETGITLMQLDVGMDTGDMLGKVRTPIGADETQGELSGRLSRLAADMVRDELPRFARGELARRAQDPAAATLAPMLVKKDGAIDFGAAASAIHDRVRGMNPRPGAFALLHGKTVKLHATSRLDGLARATSPGTVVLADKSRVIVSCGPRGEERIALVRVQMEGKRVVSAGEWVGGRGVTEGEVLSGAGR
jgi:methionyl-tRNA formyltransferase